MIHITCHKHMCLSIHPLRNTWDTGSSNHLLCDILEGWDGVGGGRRFKREQTYGYPWLIYVDIWQKPAQYC